MTPDIYYLMHEWLRTGTDSQKYHAFYRLSRPDALGYKPPKLEYPSLFQQAKNVAVAAGSVVASIVRREAVAVSQEEQDRRLAICHQCEFWDPEQKRCSKCGCFGQWKTWLASQSCPIGKW
jgi:hypothetical protein